MLYFGTLSDEGSAKVYYARAEGNWLGCIFQTTDEFSKCSHDFYIDDCCGYGCKAVGAGSC